MHGSSLGRVALGVATALTCQMAVAQGASNFATRCKEWIDKKGYSPDYIEKRTGQRQPGSQATWRGNVTPDEAKPGDVVISQFTRADGATGTRAAYVENVETDANGKTTAMTVSEWNQGKRTIDRDCFVTDEFGRESRIRLPAESVQRVWRPSLPLPPR